MGILGFTAIKKITIIANNLNSFDGQEEVVTLAATLKRRFGKSRMADVVNLGVDLHSFFSLYREGKLKDLNLANIDEETAKILAERSKPYKEDPVLKKSRALSKVYNFG